MVRYAYAVDTLVVGFGTELPSRRMNHVYSEVLAETLLELYVAGVPLPKIAEHRDMPCYTTMLRWLTDHPEFKRKFEAARLLRAIHFEQVALDAACSASDKEDVPAARLKFDAFKWGAEVNDAARYKKQVATEQTHRVQFTIVTGVPDKEEALAAPEAVATIEVKGTPVDMSPEAHGGS